MSEPVAIIGVGARFPGAPDSLAFRRLIREAAVHVQPVPAERWDHSVIHSPNRRHANKTPARAGAFMDRFDRFAPEFFGITPKRARIMDPQQRLVLEMTRQALEDAGYANRTLADRRVGVYVGASTSDHRALVCNAVTLPADLAGRCGIPPEISAEVAAAVSAALPPIQAYSIVGQQLNMIAANVSQAFDFTGPAFTLDTACSSALAALHEAVVHLRSGIVDGAVVSGVYVQLDPTIMVCFSRIAALSFRDSCRPFAADADGFVLGEGVGAVVLKRLADAQRDGDRVLAVIRGIAMNNDGRGHGPLTPDAKGQAAAIRLAWQDAGVELSTVGLLEAHATATQAGDGAELAAIRDVFASHLAAPVPISSIKANIGHGLASAGIASLLKATFAVHEGFVPPQPGDGPWREEFAAPNACLRVPAQLERWQTPAGQLRRAGVSAFGFGGTNVHVVLEQPPASVAAPRRANSTGPLRFEFSAPARELLSDYLERINAITLAELVPAGSTTLDDLAFTLAHRRTDNVRASFLAETPEQFHAGIAQLRVALQRGEDLAIATGGRSGDGRLVRLPPSPLAERRFWLIDETKKARHAPAAPALTDAVMTGEPAKVAGEGLTLVIAAISAVTAWRPEEIRPEQKFVADLGFDSLTTLEFMTVLGRSLPGIPPPPRSLFTTTLTVAELAAQLAQSSVPAAEVAERCQYDAVRHPWLRAHHPGGHALLPLAALVSAARQALRARCGDDFTIADFKVLTPVAVNGERIELAVEVDDELRFTIRAADTAAQLASGVARIDAAMTPEIAIEEAIPGTLSLNTFYAEFGFHGPALQAIDGVPVISSTACRGHIRASGDEVVTLDGALQLSLYWVAAMRKVTAVANGFASFRQLAPWPSTERITCVGRLLGEGNGTLRGDFDFRGARGELLAQWRGVEAQIIPSLESKATASAAESWPEVQALAARKAALATAGLAMPYFKSHDGTAAATTRIAGRDYLNFSAYNYLGLAGAPEVQAAAAAALATYGTSASASRVASGERPVHAALERAIADFLGCEEALVLVSGHATNVSVIGHLFGPEDLVLHDSLAHDCIVTGARLSGARRLVFPHNDVGALAHLLARERPKARRALIAVEGVYSMDGDLAPLRDVVALKRQHDALLLIDEAHSLGVLGATGRGAGEHFEVAPEDVDLWMGTLSKSLASCGGYLAGATALIDYLRFTMPGFLYSVGLPPASAAASLAALELLKAQPERVRRLQARGEYFRQLCRERGVNVGPSAHSAVVPCLTGSSDRALRLAEALGRRGINVQPIFHPAVEEGRARLRFFVTSEHSEAQLRFTADALAEEMAGWNAVPQMAGS